MNGYVKMKRLRRMKITKIVAAVTAISMTVTGLAVAASADSASPDFISEALGELTKYGIVANDMVNLVDFESNFAVKNINLGTHFHLENFSGNKHRTVSFEVTCDGYITAAEPKYCYFGVYSNGRLIDIGYKGNSVENPAPIKVEFTEPGTQRFTFTIPAEYRNSNITIHKLEPVYDDEGTYVEFVKADEGVLLAPQDNFEAECIISDSLTAGGETFGSNKTIKVGSDIFDRISDNGSEVFYTMPKMTWTKYDESDYWDVVPEFDSEGNQVYDKGVKIANGSVKFVEMYDASEKIDELLELMQSASVQLAAITQNSDNVTVYSVNGSIDCGTTEAGNILKEYSRVKNNPNAYLLVNVTLNQGQNTFAFNSGDIGAWDADECSRIIFNFKGGDINNTHVVLGDGFRGTALAPNARVSVASTICGAIYAPKVTVRSGEVHMAPYRALNHVYEAFYYEEEQTTTTEETTSETEETTSETSVETTSDTVSETSDVTTEPEETSETEDTTADTSVPETTPDTTVPETTPDTTVPETTPETSVPETTPDTTVPETTPDTTVPETTPETSVPETTPDTTVPETTPDTTVPETTPETSVPETTPDTTVPETTPDTTVPETTPETSVPETTPDTTVPETTPDTTVPETTPNITVPETTPDITVPETTPDITVPVTTPNITTRPEAEFEVPTTTTTTAPETTPEITSDITTETDPVTTTTVGNFDDENTPTTTPNNTAPLFEVPETTPPTVTEPPHFEVPETTTTTVVDIFSDINTTTPPPETEVTTTELTTTTTVPITFELEEEVPRGTVPPNVPLIEIDEEVPLADRPMNTGVDSKVGLFAVIGGAALVIGVGAQVYSVFLKKKN